MKTILKTITIILFTLSCSSDNFETKENLLIVAKNNDGLYYLDDNNNLNKIFDDFFNNQIFLEQPFTRINKHSLIVKCMGTVPNNNKHLIKWVEYKIDFKNNTCIKESEKAYRFSSKTKGQYIINNKIIKDTIINCGTIDNVHGYSIKFDIKAESLNGYNVFYDYGNIILKKDNISKLIYSYEGYSDNKTGNGIFSLEISSDGEIIIIPIIKTNILEWITYSGSGKILIYDTFKKEITELTNKRMLHPKISIDGKYIAYTNYSKKINIFNTSTKKVFKLKDLSGDSYIWIEQ